MSMPQLNGAVPCDGWQAAATAAAAPDVDIGKRTATETTLTHPPFDASVCVEKSRASQDEQALAAHTVAIPSMSCEFPSKRIHTRRTRAHLDCDVDLDRQTCI